MLGRIINRSRNIPKRMITTGGKSGYKPPTFVQSYLSDESTYPLLTIMGVATIGCAAFFVYNLTSHPDIQIRKKYRKNYLREEY